MSGRRDAAPTNGLRMSTLPPVIGLIAGNGRFPLVFAEAARRQGVRVIVAAFKGDTSLSIHLVSRDVRWFALKDFRAALGFFRENGARHVLMAGQVRPERLFAGEIKADPGLTGFFDLLKDWRCDTIFSAVGELLASEGMELLDSTLLVREYLAPKGTLTRRAPTEKELEDIQFGIGVAKHVGAIDIGQTVVIKDRAILAVEALEGTDRCILRGGTIAREGAVVVKTSKPAQDNRFDVPVIGPGTVGAMKKAGARCVAIEAGRTLIIDRDRTVALANKAGICILAA